MPFLEAGFEGAFNGTTQVDVTLATPASTRRLVRSVLVTNPDTIQHRFTVSKSQGAGPTVRPLFVVTLNPGEFFDFDRLTVLDNPNEKLVGVLAAASVTTAPVFDVAFADAS